MYWCIVWFFKRFIILYLLQFTIFFKYKIWNLIFVSYHKKVSTASLSPNNQNKISFHSLNKNNLITILLFLFFANFYLKYKSILRMIFYLNNIINQNINIYFFLFFYQNIAFLSVKKYFYYNIAACVRCS